MEKGVIQETKKGTPQGGNLSPLLSNIMLNELDKELEKRGLNFVRYADDCLIMVKSEKAANRVMERNNNTCKLIKRISFGFRNFRNMKSRIMIITNIFRNNRREYHKSTVSPNVRITNYSRSPQIWRNFFFYKFS